MAIKIETIKILTPSYSFGTSSCNETIVGGFSTAHGTELECFGSEISRVPEESDRVEGTGLRFASAGVTTIAESSSKEQGGDDVFSENVEEHKHSPPFDAGRDPRCARLSCTSSAITKG